jgi:hypothetical protein
MPATKKRINATVIWSEAMAQTITGTSKMRASVMRLGRLKDTSRQVGNGGRNIIPDAPVAKSGLRCSRATDPHASTWG